MSAGGVGDGVDWRVGAEVDDPPASRAQRQPEGDQLEVVAIQWQSGRSSL